MKRVLGLSFFIVLAGTAWWNRYPMMFLAYHHFHRAPEMTFSEYHSNGITFYYIAGSPIKNRLQEIAGRVSDNIASAGKDIGGRLPQDMKVYIHNDWEEKGDHIEDVRVASSDPEEDTIHYIVNDQYDGTREREEYEVLLYAKLGKPACDLCGRYAAAALSGTWNQKTLSEWSDFLLARKLPPSLPSFFTDQKGISNFIVVPWNAILARWIRQQYGWNAFADLYQNGVLPKDYETGWKQYLQSLGSPPSPYRPPFKPEFQKGISYAYWNSYDGGYATEKSKKSLDELRKLGTNWVAAIPYGFMPSPTSSEIHFAGNNIGSESDESMFALADDARKRGMRVMMKPQIWIGHEAWTGQVDFANDSNWQQWFDSYENWITHYAIISELMHADLFCIGTELVQTTLKRPQDWRRLIQHIRNVYHGPLVYAANYGSEFEGMTFWDAFDYIGLDNYYPVRSTLDQGPDVMARNFLEQRDRIKSIALRFKKPLIFTEVGYQAVEGAGMGSKEWDYAKYDEKMQNACYDLLLNTYWNENWFYGMYWWKWFSDPDDRGKNADPHSPHDRLAEKTLEKSYLKER